MQKARVVACKLHEITGYICLIRRPCSKVLPLIHNAHVQNTKGEKNTNRLSSCGDQVLLTADGHAHETETLHFESMELAERERERDCLFLVPFNSL